MERYEEHYYSSLKDVRKELIYRKERFNKFDCRLNEMRNELV